MGVSGRGGVGVGEGLLTLYVDKMPASCLPVLPPSRLLTSDAEARGLSDQARDATPIKLLLFKKTRGWSKMHAQKETHTRTHTHSGSE